MDSSRQQATAPWYRHPYVWLLISFPAMAVIGGIAMLVVAIQTDDGLVEDDYYKKGLEINRTFERDRAAADKKLSAELIPGDDRQTLQVILRGNEKLRAPDSITISFIHATRKGLDQELILPAAGAGIYRGSMPDIPPGIWNVHIEAQDWRLLQRWDNIRPAN